MKKKMMPHIIAAIGLVVLGLLIIGCSTTAKTLVYDPSIPIAEQCTLEIAGGIHVRSFDGETVGAAGFLGETALAGWGLGGTAANMHGSKGSATVIIPQGSHNLLTSFYMGNADQHAILRDVLITYDFVAGHTYRLKAILYNDNLFTKEVERIAQEDYSLYAINYMTLDTIEFVIENKGILPITLGE